MHISLRITWADLYGHQYRCFSRRAAGTCLFYSFSLPNGCWHICGKLMMDGRNGLRNAWETEAGYTTNRRSRPRLSRVSLHPPERPQQTRVVKEKEIAFLFKNR